VATKRKADGRSITNAVTATSKSLPELQSTLEQVRSEANGLARSLAAAELAADRARGHHKLGYIDSAARIQVEAARDEIRRQYDDAKAAERLLSEEVTELEAEAARNTLEVVRSANAEAAADIENAAVTTVIEHLSGIAHALATVDGDNGHLEDTHQYLINHDPAAYHAVVADYQQRKQEILETHKRAYREAGLIRERKVMVLTSASSTLSHAETEKQVAAAHDAEKQARETADTEAKEAHLRAEDEYFLALKHAGLGVPALTDRQLRAKIGETAVAVIERLIPNSIRVGLVPLKRWERASVNDGGRTRLADPKEQAREEEALRKAKQLRDRLIDG
jgi:hypothetical protein